MSKIKTHVKKGDSVEVIAGNHKGEIGTVMQVLPTRGYVLIEGIRMIKKHERKTQERPDGGIIEREGPIHISNVKLVQKSEK